MSGNLSPGRYSDFVEHLRRETGLDKLYARIPAVRGCRTDCNDCCGPVPMRDDEAALVQHVLRPIQTRPGEHMTPTRASCTTCAYHTAQGCSIYEARPLMCRLFGAVDDPLLTCPHGAKAKRPLSAQQAADLVAKYKGAFHD